MKGQFLSIIGAITLVFLAQPATAEMYKWTDKNGKVHYTQTPPPADAKSENIEAEIRLSTGKLGNTPPAPTSSQTQDPLEQAKQEGKTSEQQHREFCEQQADLLKKLAANSLVRWQDKEGEPRYLTAEEKQGKMDEIQKNLDTMCKPEMFRNSKNRPKSQTEAAHDARKQTDKTLQDRQPASGQGNSGAPAAPPGPDAASLQPATS